MKDLIAALVATGATLAFDAIGGGRGVNRLLTAMEIAAAQTGPWSRYGSEEPKQAYIYGQLDLGATELTRGYGWVWSVSGWLLTPFMKRAGPEVVARLGMGCLRLCRYEVGPILVALRWVAAVCWPVGGSDGPYG